MWVGISLRAASSDDSILLAVVFWPVLGRELTEKVEFTSVCVCVCDKSLLFLINYPFIKTNNKE